MTKEFWQDFGDLDFMARRGAHPSYQRVVDVIRDQDLQSCRVLDVGVLSAVLYPLLREAWPAIDYTGVDINPTVIEENSRRYPDAVWQCADIEKLPFGDGQFDVVVVRHVIEHLAAYQAALAEVTRVAGRTLILCFFAPLEEQQVLRQFTDRDNVHVNTFARGEFLDAMPPEWRIVHEERVPDPRRENQIIVFARG